MSSAYMARIPNIVLKRKCDIFTYLYKHGMRANRVQNAPIWCSIRCNSMGKLSYFHGTSSTPLIQSTVSEMLDNSLKKNGSREAVVDCEQNLRKTFSEYINDIDQLAAGLVTLGLSKGDRLGIWATNSYQWLTTEFACAKTGIILVSFNPLYQAKELEACIKFTGIKSLFVGEKLRDFSLYKILEHVIPNLSQSQSGQIKSDKFPELKNLVMLSEKRYPGMYRYIDVFNAAKPEDYAKAELLKNSVQTFDTLQLFFTSGTTGTPKAVTSTHHAALNGLRFNSMDVISEEGDRLCNCAPLFHALGSMIGSYMSMYAGNTLVLPSSTYSTLHTLTALHQEKCTSIVGTPTMFFDILSNPQIDKLQFPHLTKLLSGGSPVPVELYRRVREKFKQADLYNGYAATETTLGILLQKPKTKSPDGSVGHVQDHVEVRVVDDHGRLVPWNTPGELQIRSYLIAPGYWNNPEKTAEAMTADGFYKSGDVGVLSADGVIRIVGRMKDVIIRGGENIYPSEVEDHLATHPNISEVHIFGIPDERLGEQVCAWIISAKEHQLTTEEVRKYCEGHLASFKIPKFVTFVEGVPKLPTGKVAKNVMQAKMIESLKLLS